MQDLRTLPTTTWAPHAVEPMAALASVHEPTHARATSFRTFAVRWRKLSDRDRSEMARLNGGLDGINADALEASGGRFLLAKTQDDGVLGYGYVQPAAASSVPADWVGSQGRGAAGPLQLWELGGLAINRDSMATFGCRAGAVARRLVAESLQFALCNGIARYRLVTSPEIERLLLDEGVPLHRLDAPMAIDAQDARCFGLDVDADTLGALGSPLPTAPVALQCAEPGRRLADLQPVEMPALIDVLMHVASATLALSAGALSAGRWSRRITAARSQRSKRG